MKNISKRLTILFVSVLLLSTLVQCEKDKGDDLITDTGATLIDSIVSDKDTIWSGPQDPATITCYASGNDLSYVWFSQLGDIVPVNDDGSVIRFTAADCCEGDREITCTVTSGDESDTEKITLRILVDYGSK